jgi:hypothetical protein
LSKGHDVLGSNGVNSSLNLFRTQSSACGDNLASNVLGDGSSTVKGEKDGSFELRLGALGFGFANVVGETRPFTESEVNKIINSGNFVGYEIDTPETSTKLAFFIHNELNNIPSVTVTR